MRFFAAALLTAGLAMCGIGCDGQPAGPENGGEGYVPGNGGLQPGPADSAQQPGSADPGPADPGLQPGFGQPSPQPSPQPAPAPDETGRDALPSIREPELQFPETDETDSGEISPADFDASPPEPES